MAQGAQFLDGVRIVTIAGNVPGPMAVARLREAGASVVKIEPPAGDPLAGIAPAWYGTLHAGIPVERIDLKSDAGHARIDALLHEADVLITSQRPSALLRLRLGPEHLRARCPALRLLRIVGNLRDVEEAGHDLTYQARTGLVGQEMPRTLAADVMTSERVFSGVLALLRQHPGSWLDVGMVQSLESLLAPLRHGLTAPGGPLGGGAINYRVYDAKTGRVAVAALEPHFESRLYAQLGLPAGTDLTSRLLERSATEWETWARDHDLPLVAVAGIVTYNV